MFSQRCVAIHNLHLALTGRARVSSRSSSWHSPRSSTANLPTPQRPVRCYTANTSSNNSSSRYNAIAARCRPQLQARRTYLAPAITNHAAEVYQRSTQSTCTHNQRVCLSTSVATSNGPIESEDKRAPRLSVAIVGAGPSGFYASKYLTSSVLKRIQSTEEVAFHWSGIDVDIIERLPTPYGLVRYGVAPDHPEVKNVENDFASLFQKEEVAGDSSLSYFGNVNVGKDISLSKLQSIYDIVILAYGCQADKSLGIEGILEGVLSAREFVAWYNGHPEFGHIGPIVKRCLWKDDEDESIAKEESVSPARVVVIGQGNVALDVARILAKGKPGLTDTDTPSSVLEILKGGVSHVSVVGRRGHVQGAFTIKELRELTKLKKEGHDTAFIVRKDELDLGMTESSSAELKGPSGRPKTRINKLLQETATTEAKDSDATKQVDLRFLLSPIRLEPNDSTGSRVGRVICERTKLEGEPFQQRPVGTNETETLPADLVLVSIGYRGMPLDGMDERQLFDSKRGIVANDHGKVTGVNNLFVTGWIKRGPSGIIGTNIVDAKDTVSSVMKSIDSEPLSSDETSASVKGRAMLTEYLSSHDVEYIDWHQALKIEAAESDLSRLRSDAQPREKFLSVREMLEVAS